MYEVCSLGLGERVGFLRPVKIYMKFTKLWWKHLCGKRPSNSIWPTPKKSKSHVRSPQTGAESDWYNYGDKIGRNRQRKYFYLARLIIKYCRYNNRH